MLAIMMRSPVLSVQRAGGVRPTPAAVRAFERFKAKRSPSPLKTTTAKLATNNQVEIKQPDAHSPQSPKPPPAAVMAFERFKSKVGEKRTASPQRSAGSVPLWVGPSVEEVTPHTISDVTIAVASSAFDKFKAKATERNTSNIKFPSAQSAWTPDRNENQTSPVLSPLAVAAATKAFERFKRSTSKSRGGLQERDSRTPTKRMQQSGLVEADLLRRRGCVTQKGLDGFRYSTPHRSNRQSHSPIEADSI